MALKLISGLAFAALVACPVAHAEPDYGAYLSEYHAVYPPQPGETDADAIQMGQLNCWSIGRNGYNATGRRLMSSGFTEYQAVRILEISMRYLCPDVRNPPFTS